MHSYEWRVRHIQQQPERLIEPFIAEGGGCQAQHDCVWGAALDAVKLSERFWVEQQQRP